MKCFVLATFALLGVFLLFQNASAQLGSNEAFSMIGNGFAVSQDSVLETNLDLLFTTPQIRNKIDLSLQSGVIVIGDRSLDLSNFRGNILRNGKYFSITSQAVDSEGKQSSFKAFGRLIDSTSSDSVYNLSGILTDSANKITKMVFTTKVSEFIPKTPETQKSKITVKILKGSSNPSGVTYQDYKQGTRFQYFSEDRITLPPGSTITFVNEDVVSHTLKSGTANYVSRHKTFDADGKISSGEIKPGQSWDVTFDTPGFYRLFDEKYQWMDLTIFVTPQTTSEVLGTTIKPKN